MFSKLRKKSVKFLLLLVNNEMFSIKFHLTSQTRFISYSVNDIVRINIISLK